MIKSITYFFCILFLTHHPVTSHDNYIKIGVVSQMGDNLGQQNWEPTAEYLSSKIPGYHFKIVYYNMYELFSAVERKQIHYIIVDPALYIGMETHDQVECIATLQRGYRNVITANYGSVIFTKVNRTDISTLNDISGKSVMAVTENSFGGWIMSLREIKKRGIDPYTKCNLSFAGSCDSVVRAIQNGNFDVGIVRTQVLEIMADSGLINLRDFKILNEQRMSTHHPFHRSTLIYPEWPFAKLPHVSDNDAQKVVMALFTMPPNHPASRAISGASWTIPLNYQSVDRCMKELKVGPYNRLGNIPVNEIIDQYWVEILLSLLFTCTLILLLIFSIRMNIKLKIAQVKLKESEEKFRVISVSAQDAIIMTDSKGLVTFWNEAAEKTFMYKRDEILGHNLHQYIVASEHFTSIDKGYDHFRLTGTGPAVGKILELQAIRKDGTTIPVELSLTSVQLYGEWYAIGIVRDVSERKIIEQQIHETTERYKLLFNSGNDAIIVHNYERTSKKNSIIEVNDIACKLLEYSKEEMLKLTVEKLLDSEHIADRPNLSEKTLYQAILSTKNGTRIPVEINSHRFYLNGEAVVMSIARDITDRKNAENLLIESEKKYRLLFDKIQESFALHEIICDENNKPVNYRFLDVNPAFEKFTGLIKENLIGKTVLEVLPNTESYWIEAYGHVAQTGQPTQFELYSGEMKKYYNVTAFRPQKNQFATVFNDITDRIENEKHLQQQKKLLDELFNGIQEGIGIIDDNAKIVFCNQAYAEIFEKDKQELIGQNQIHLFTFGARHTLNKLVKSKKYLQKSVLDLPLLTNSGKNKYIRVGLTPRFDEKGMFIGAFGTVLDITEAHKAVMALKDSEERYKKLSALTFEGIILHKNRILLDSNKSFLDMFGYKRREILNKDIFKKIVCPEYLEIINDKIREKYTLPYEIMAKNKLGVQFPVELEAKNIRYDGQDIRVVAVRDISWRKVVENELQDAKVKAEAANNAKSAFLANMSHEIRTPLNAILGFSDILREQLTDIKQRQYLSSISSSGKTLLQLINDVLDLSKIEAGKLELQYRIVNLPGILNDLQQVFMWKIKEKKLDFYIDLNPDVPAFLVLDETRLRQVLLNLAGNAVKFTDSGNVRISVNATSKEHHPFIDLVISVQDTGIGIPKANLESIFEEFRQRPGQDTRKYEGTGLGLAITRRLVEMMNGSITVASQPGSGSTFSIKLRNVEIASSPENDYLEAETTNVHSVQFHKNKVLIVDDVEANRKLLKSYLETMNLRIIMAKDGREAIEKVQKYIPSIILMDLKMPVMDGFDAIAFLNSNPKLNKIPIIIIAASLKSQNEKLHGLKYDGYLVKPVKQEQIVKELMRFLPFKTSNQNTTPFENTTEIKEPLSALVVTRLPQILQQLKGGFLEKWTRIKDTQIINQIEDFAQEIAAFGEANDCSFLNNWGNKLFLQAEAFDIENLSHTLLEFPNIIAMLEKEMTINKVGV